MPKIYGGIGFVNIDGDDRSYSLDIGDKRSIVAGFYLPKGFQGMTVAQFQAIATFAGGHPLKLGKTEINEYSNPCPSDANFSPRKLKFIMSNGGSLTIPFADIQTPVSTATQIKSLLEQINTEVKVVCIELLGEDVPNLNLELGVSFNEAARTQSAGNGAYYSGKITYQTHIGSPIPAYPVKVASVLQVVPPIFQDIWQSCVGDFQSFPPCGTGGRSNPVKHRRYIVQYQTEPDVARPNEPIFESRELPINSIDPTQIKNCGVLLATRESIFCVGYRGESNRNVHKAIV